MAAYDIIQHLRGTAQQWADHDIIIPNGEWAFEEMLNGSRQGKIGNGVNTWSELPYAFSASPDPGLNGKSLEFLWNDTQLGIRIEGESTYQYVNLKGKDGYTPQKGVDYYTDDDKAEMVSALLVALPVYEGEVESV